MPHKWSRRIPRLQDANNTLDPQTRVVWNYDLLAGISLPDMPVLVLALDPHGPGPCALMLNEASAVLLIAKLQEALQLLQAGLSIMLATGQSAQQVRETLATWYPDTPRDDP